MIIFHVQRIRRQKSKKKAKTRCLICENVIESYSLLKQETKFEMSFPCLMGTSVRSLNVFKFFSILFSIFCLDLQLCEQHRKVSGNSVRPNPFRKPFLSEFKTLVEGALRHKKCTNYAVCTFLKGVFALS